MNSKALADIEEEESEYINDRFERLQFVESVLVSLEGVGLDIYKIPYLTSISRDRVTEFLEGDVELTQKEREEIEDLIYKYKGVKI